nr:MAG TPA: DNA-directed RNA polymerase [Caudoviricetes sp.]
MTIKDALINIVDNAFDELDKQPQRVETTDYIRRESVGNLCLKNLEIINGRCYVNMEELLNLVDGIPAADVEPVRHGAWCQCFEDWRQQQEGNKCSVCGFEYYGTGVRTFHYCPSCGAKMDLTDKAPEG